MCFIPITANTFSNSGKDKYTLVYTSSCQNSCSTQVGGMRPHFGDWKIDP